MYTEDDDKVEVKNTKSNIKYSDFYTSFNDIGKDNSNGKKNNKKKRKEPLETSVKEEQDYQDFYGSNSEEIENTTTNNDNNGSKKFLKIVIIGIIILILIILLIVIFSKKKEPKGNIELSKTDYALKIGEKEYISFKIVDTESQVTASFSSSNTNIATVSNSGEIVALSVGDATITIRYTIDGVTRTKKCTVKVNGDGSTNQNLTLKLNLSGGKDDTWTNSDVTIAPEASSIFGIASIKYGLNCSNSCEYKDITNSKISITSSGVSKVKIVAKDNKNQEAVKEVTIKIDKEAPSVTLDNDNTNITSNKDVEVCATCTDKLSGCKQAKVCKRYNTSKTNEVITVEDMAGNKANSKAFNVTIQKTNPLCSLRVSNDGTVTATVHGEASYYGFNSSYSGTNQLSKKIEIEVSKRGDIGAKIIYYYVKAKNGTTGKCHITVIKKCTCANNSNSSNCQLSCTFSSQ